MISRKRTLRLAGLALLVLAILAASGCAPGATPAPTSAPQATKAPATTAPGSTTAPQATSAPAATSGSSGSGSTLKLGLLTDDTGALAIYGPMLENGFKLGLDYATKGTNTVGGKTITVITKDTASKPETGVSQARELIEKDGVDLLVGGVSSAVALAVEDVAKANKKIYIAEPAAGTDITGKNFNPYVFRTSRTNDQDALTMGAGITKLGKKFIQVAQDYAFGYGSAAAFYTVVKSNGGSFVVNDNADKSGAIFIPVDTTDFTPYLQQVLDSKADAVIVSWAGANGVALFQQMQQLGVFKAMTVATGLADNKSLAGGFKDAVGSIGLTQYHYTLPKNPINDWLVQKHKEQFKSPPDLFTEGGFALAQMVVEGLKKTNGDSNADKLIAAFEGLQFETPKGTYKIRPYDHVALQPMYLVKLTNVTDPDFKFEELIRELTPEDTAPPCKLEGDFKSRCPKP